MTKRVDSYKYIDIATSQIVKAWIAREPEHDIPWAPLTKPLGGCRVALLSTAAIATNEQQPFDKERERREPWWGDPTHRVLPKDVDESGVDIHHLHIDKRPAMKDLDVVLPLRRLGELVEEGMVGEVAPRHVSIMGYILKPKRLLEETAPAIVEVFRKDEVDAVVLVPA